MRNEREFFLTARLPLFLTARSEILGIENDIFNSLLTFYQRSWRMLVSVTINVESINHFLAQFNFPSSTLQFILDPRWFYFCDPVLNWNAEAEGQWYSGHLVIVSVMFLPSLLAAFNTQIGFCHNRYLLLSNFQEKALKLCQAIFLCSTTVWVRAILSNLFFWTWRWRWEEAPTPLVNKPSVLRALSGAISLVSWLPWKAKLLRCRSEVIPVTNGKWPVDSSKEPLY